MAKPVVINSLISTLRAFVVTGERPLPATFPEYLTDIMCVGDPDLASQAKSYLRSTGDDKAMGSLKSAAEQAYRWCRFDSKFTQSFAGVMKAEGIADSNDHLALKRCAAVQTLGQKYFFEQLLPFLMQRALEWPTLFPEGKLPLVDTPSAQTLVANGGRVEQTISFTRRQTLCYNALAFLGHDCVVKHREVGSFSWRRLMMGSPLFAVGVERLICQLAYFDYWKTHWPSSTENEQQQQTTVGPQLDEKIVFTRVSVTNDTTPDWGRSQKLMVELPDAAAASSSSSSVCSELASKGVVIDEHFMEDFLDDGSAGGRRAKSMVDFANESYCASKIGMIPSATQEEVLVSICPEMMTGFVTFTTMDTFEAIICVGAYFYCDYKGYRDSFRFDKPSTFALSSPTASPTARARPVIIAIDAHVNCGQQFGQSMVQRDLMKMWAGYSPECVLSPIGSGALGCGAFGGDMCLKFLQQLMTVAHTDGGGQRKLMYYNHRNPAEFTAMRDLMRLKKVTVADVYQWMLAFGRSGSARVSQRSSDAAPTKGRQAFAESKGDGSKDSASASAAGAAVAVDVATQIKQAEELGEQLLEDETIAPRTFSEFVMLKLIEYKSE